MKTFMGWGDQEISPKDPPGHNRGCWASVGLTVSVAVLVAWVAVVAVRSWLGV